MAQKTVPAGTNLGGLVSENEHLKPYFGPGNSRGCASSCMSINGEFCIQRRLHRSQSFQIADIAECCFIREVLMIAVALPNLEKARGLYLSYRLRAGENRSHLHNRASRKQHES